MRVACLLAVSFAASVSVAGGGGVAHAAGGYAVYMSEASVPPTVDLSEPVKAVASPDGQNAYAISRVDYGSPQNAVAHFRRDSTGALTFEGCFADSGDFGCRPLTNGTVGLPVDIVVSPDGRDLYTAGRIDSSIAHFRIAGDGTLAFTGCTGPTFGCEPLPSGNQALSEPTAIAISPDGSSVYVTSGSNVIHLRRAGDGSLAFSDCVSWGEPACTSRPYDCSVDPPCRGSGAFTEPRAVAVSPNGRAVYVASNFNKTTYAPNAVGHFRRAPDGHLSYADCIGEGADLCAPLPAGITLAGMEAVAVSPDSAHVYVSAESNDRTSEAIAHFKAREDGALEFADCIGGKPSGCTAPAAVLDVIHFIRALALGPDGRDLYGNALGTESLVHFGIGADGSLALLDCVGLGAGCWTGPAGGFNNQATTISPDGRNLYLAGGSSIGVFARSATPPGPDSSELPQVTTEPANYVDAFDAQFNGTVRLAWHQAAKLHFEYGRTTAYGSFTPVPDNGAYAARGPYETIGTSQYLVGLASDTSYHYRLVASGSFGTVYGNDQTFRTPALNVATPPEVTTEGNSAFAERYTTLHANIDPRGRATKYYFEYGTNTSYGHRAPQSALASDWGSGISQVAVPLTGLSPGATYHFRVVASNSSGTTRGDDAHFTTAANPPPPPAPALLGESARDVTDDGATIEASVNPYGGSTSYFFEYGPTSSFGGQVPATAQPVGSDSSAHVVGERLSGLEKGTTYHYRVVLTSAVGTITGPDQTFTPGVVEPPPPPNPVGGGGGSGSGSGSGGAVSPSPLAGPPEPPTLIAVAPIGRLAIRLPHSSLRRVVRSGLQVRVFSSVLGRLTVRATLDRRTAHVLDSRIRRLVGQRLKRIDRAGQVSFRIRIRPGLARALRSLRRLGLNLSALAVDGAGEHTRIQRHVVIR
jgi:hypothetical protein